MKAVFAGTQMYSNSVFVSFNVYDDTLGFIDNFVAQLVIGTDITPTIPGATLQASCSTQMVAWATPRGYSLSSTDIIWGGFEPYNPTEIAALQAARSFSSPTFSNATTATKLSASRDASVQYSFDASVSISLLAGQTVTATLKYADDSGMTTNVVTMDSQLTGNSGVLGLTQTNTLKVSGIVPKNKYRQVTFAITGTGAAAPTAIKSSQEVLL